MIRVGPAGWSYPDWDGRVYPRHRPHGFHPLSFLARTFDTIEINSTFYAMPRAENASRWAALVADRPQFRFFAKLHRDFTHLPEALEARSGGGGAWEDKARQFQEGLAPLVRARRLAGVLAQFPISFLHGNTEVRRLGRLRALFPDVPMILEVRHESWFARPSVDQIRGLSYSLAYVDMPPAWNHPPDWHEPTGPIGYLRLHGRNSHEWFRSDAERDDKYDYLYREAELDALSRKAKRIAAQHDETAVVTNNHFSGQAVANAIDLMFLLHGVPVATAPEIVESFPHLKDRTRIEGQQPLF